MSRLTRTINDLTIIGRSTRSSTASRQSNPTLLSTGFRRSEEPRQSSNQHHPIPTSQPLSPLAQKLPFQKRSFSSFSLDVTRDSAQPYRMRPGQAALRR